MPIFLLTQHNIDNPRLSEKYPWSAVRTFLYNRVFHNFSFFLLLCTKEYCVHSNQRRHVLLIPMDLILGPLVCLYLHDWIKNISRYSKRVFEMTFLTLSTVSILHTLFHNDIFLLGVKKITTISMNNNNFLLNLGIWLLFHFLIDLFDF